MATVFQLLVGGLALGKRSFHQIDLFARQPDACAWLGSKRKMVASDCTFWRVLPNMDRHQLREELQQAHVLLRTQGHGKVELPGGRTIRAAAVDGSVFCGRYASAVEILGAHAAMVDLEPYQEKGKELPASEQVLRRVFARHGRRFADIVLGDGLYMTQGMLALCRKQLGTHLLVKTKELGTLNILKDAEAIFQSEEFARDVQHVRGVDARRGMCYQVWAAAGFHHNGFSDELKVARVEIVMLKGPRKGARERFWIVTTDETLRAEQMRELAHLRWSIENHGFRALNAAMNSKHVWTRGKHAPEVFEALMLLMFLAFTLLMAYQAQLDPEDLRKSLGIGSITLGYLMECLILSLPAAAGLFAPVG